MENDPVPMADPGFKPATKKPRKKRVPKPYIQLKVDGRTFGISSYAFENVFLRLNLLNGKTLFIRTETIKRIEVSGLPQSGTAQATVPRLGITSTLAAPPPHVASFNSARNAALSASMALGDFGDQ